MPATARIEYRAVSRSIVSIAAMPVHHADIHRRRIQCMRQPGVADDQIHRAPLLRRGNAGATGGAAQPYAVRGVMFQISAAHSRIARSEEASRRVRCSARWNQQARRSCQRAPTALHRGKGVEVGGHHEVVVAGQFIDQLTKPRGSSGENTP